MTRPPLLRRLPSVRWRAPDPYPLVPSDAPDRYPALAGELAVLEARLVPVFRAFDAEALRAQNAYRLLELLLILGGLTATTLGAVHAGLGDAVPALGWAQAAVAAAVTFASVYVARSHLQRRYLTARLKAERLRSEYFQFLGRLGPYAADGDDARAAALDRRVASIELEEATT